MVAAQKTTTKRKTQTGYALAPVSTAIRPIVRKFLPQKSVLFQQLFDIWPDLVAATEASGAIPEKLAMPRNKQNQAVLHIWAQSGAQAMEISFSKAHLMHLINTTFGYNLVADIRVLAFPETKKNAAESVITASKRDSVCCQSLDKALAGISNPQLKSALTSLGAVLPPQTIEKGQSHA
jgi:hypothetical protein